MTRLASIFCAAALLAGTGAAAQIAEVGDNARTVEVELREGGEIVAAPTLRMQIGRPTAVDVGPYSLRLRMDRAAGPEGSPAPFLIRSSLYRAGSGWTLVASPAMTVVEGEPSRLRIAGHDGSDLSLAVLVR